MSFSIELTVHGVLRAGNWRTEEELQRISEDDKRNTLICVLRDFSNQEVGYFQGCDNAALIGKGGNVAFLRAARIRDDGALKNMSDEDHRNTVICALNINTGVEVGVLQGEDNLGLVRRAANWLGGRTAQPVSENSKRLLSGLNLFNVELEKTQEADIPQSIDWTQTGRALFGNTEKYQECTYRLKGTKLPAKVKVFVADSCGAPPATFHTDGHQQNGATLHFGYIYHDEEKDVKAIFFVIQPAAWEPFQKRFRTNTMLGMLDEGLKYLAEEGGGKVGTCIGAALGTLIPIPGAGTVVGAAVGYCVGEAATAIVDGLAGDYLHYVG